MQPAVCFSFLLGGLGSRDINLLRRSDLEEDWEESQLIFFVQKVSHSVGFWALSLLYVAACKHMGKILFHQHETCGALTFAKI